MCVFYRWIVKNGSIQKWFGRKLLTVTSRTITSGDKGETSSAAAAMGFTLTLRPLSEGEEKEAAEDTAAPAFLMPNLTDDLRNAALGLGLIRGGWRRVNWFRSVWPEQSRVLEMAADKVASIFGKERLVVWEKYLSTAYKSIL